MFSNGLSWGRTWVKYTYIVLITSTYYNYLFPTLKLMGSASQVSKAFAPHVWGWEFDPHPWRFFKVYNYFSRYICIYWFSLLKKPPNQEPNRFSKFHELGTRPVSEKIEKKSVLTGSLVRFGSPFFFFYTPTLDELTASHCHLIVVFFKCWCYSTHRNIGENPTNTASISPK